MLKKFVMVLALASLCSFGLVGCGGSKPAATDGKKTEKKVEEKAKEGADKAKEGAEDAKEAVKDAAEDVKDAAKEAAE